ncbi:MAG TPA: ORF6N domain-containing protein [Phycisphaerales bacterium]|nr:ORF6N domain-containing protein [Phycisphaerales bacterium]
MAERTRQTLAPSHDRLQHLIWEIRGERVILDQDLAVLYEVTTKALGQAVRRNLPRFPEDFMFQLTPEEFAALRSQTVTSNKPGRGGRRYAPYAFTEQGVAMLSGVLHSERAIQANIEIMRAFVRLRAMLGAHADLARRINALEARYDDQFRAVFDAIRDLMDPPEEDAPKKPPIGFRDPDLVEQTKNRAATSGRTRKRRGPSPAPYTGNRQAAG